jgi:hypothetical protein
MKKAELFSEQSGFLNYFVVKAPGKGHSQLDYCLHRFNIIGLGTFGALADSELHFLAFGQGFEARAFDGLEMCEHIWAVFLRNETKTFGFVEPLYCTCSI